MFKVNRKNTGLVGWIYSKLASTRTILRNVFLSLNTFNLSVYFLFLNLSMQLSLGKIFNFSRRFKMTFQVWPSMALMQNWFWKELTVTLILNCRANLHIQKLLINPFNATVSCIYPLKTSENLTFSGVIEMGQWHEVNRGHVFQQNFTCIFHPPFLRKLVYKIFNYTDNIDLKPSVCSPNLTKIASSNSVLQNFACRKTV